MSACVAHARAYLRRRSDRRTWLPRDGAPAAGRCSGGWRTTRTSACWVSAACARSAALGQSPRALLLRAASLDRTCLSRRLAAGWTRPALRCVGPQARLATRRGGARVRARGAVARASRRRRQRGSWRRWRRSPTQSLQRRRRTKARASRLIGPLATQRRARPRMRCRTARRSAARSRCSARRERRRNLRVTARARSPATRAPLGWWPLHRRRARPCRSRPR